MIWLSLILGALLAFWMGVFFAKEKLVSQAMVVWLGGAFYSGYMLCLAIN